MNNNIVFKNSEGLKVFEGQEGVDYINVAAGLQRDESASMLAKMLAPDNAHTFYTAFGPIISMKTFSDFITTPGYPVELLNRVPKSAKAYNSIPTKRVTIPNYYALLALGLYWKIKSSKRLYMALKANELPFTSLTKTAKIFGTSVAVKTVNPKMEYYVILVQEFQKLIKDGKFNDDNVVKDLIKRCMFAPEKDLFDSLPFEVNLTSSILDTKGEESSEQSTEEQE